jgi:hypothetical protein
MTLVLPLPKVSAHQAIVQAAVFLEAAPAEAEAAGKPSGVFCSGKIKVRYNKIIIV